MKFLIDNQLPPALARFIESEFGEDVIHVAEIGLRDAADVEIWEYCAREDRILIIERRGFRDYGLSQSDRSIHLGASRQLPS